MCVCVCVFVFVFEFVFVFVFVFVFLCVEAAEKESGSENESDINISKVMDILAKSTLFVNKYTLVSIHCRHMYCAHLKDALRPTQAKPRRLTPLSILIAWPPWSP